MPVETEGLVIEKVDGARNDWLAYWNGVYAADLSNVVFDVEHFDFSLSDAIRKIWKETTGMNPTDKQVSELRHAIQLLELWYVGGEILKTGKYQVRLGHIVEYRERKET